MTLRTRILMVAGSLLVAWSFSTSAQTPRVQTPGNPTEPDKIFSGNELGFRITGHEGPIPVGTFMVRLEGRWVEVGTRSEPQVRKAAE